MSGNGVLDFRLSEHSVLVSCKRNHFFFPSFLPVCLLSAPHVVLESENSSGMVSLVSVLSLPSTGNPSIRGTQGMFLRVKGSFFFFHPSDEWKLSSNADANGNAQPSSLAAKGYRSVHPSLPSSKPQVGVCPRAGWGPLLSRIAYTCACPLTRLDDGLDSESHF